MDGPREFPITSWSVVRQAGPPGSPEHQRQLRRLAKLYWRPIYFVIRRGWRRSETDAKDLTQEFFATVVIAGELPQSFHPERGSFRAFLRGAITNFMRNVVRDAGRQKRGGDATIVSFDDMTDDGALDEVEASVSSPEALFDAAWVRVALKQALALTEERLAAGGRAAAFEAFRRYDLDDGGERPSYAALGAALGMSGPQVMHALRHAREAFRCAVTDVVAEYADGPDEIAREIALLIEG